MTYYAADLVDRFCSGNDSQRHIFKNPEMSGAHAAGPDEAAPAPVPGLIPRLRMKETS